MPKIVVIATKIAENTSEMGKIRLKWHKKGYAAMQKPIFKAIMVFIALITVLGTGFALVLISEMCGNINIVSILIAILVVWGSILLLRKVLDGR